MAAGSEGAWDGDVRVFLCAFLWGFFFLGFGVIWVLSADFWFDFWFWLVIMLRCGSFVERGAVRSEMGVGFGDWGVGNRSGSRIKSLSMKTKIPGTQRNGATPRWG